MSDLDFEAVVVTYNSAGDIRPCLSSLQNACSRVVVIDNASRDDTVNIVNQEFPKVEIIPAERNLGYGEALNLGIARTASPFVVAANADTIFPAGSLQALERFLKAHPKVGVLGSQELFPDGSWQRSYGAIPGLYEAAQTLLGVTSLIYLADRISWRYLSPRGAKRVGYVDGAVMMIRRAAFDAIGGFDHKFHFYCEDADFCLRLAHAGWEVVSMPSVSVIHARGGSSTKAEGYSDRLLRSLASAQRQLIKKHNPGWHLPLHRQLCILHARKMSLIYRLLRVLRLAPYEPRASMPALAFERWGHIWAELSD